MRTFKVTKNGKKEVVKANSWWQVFTLAMVGHKKPPASLSIIPIKRS